MFKFCIFIYFNCRILLSCFSKIKYILLKQLKLYAPNLELLNMIPYINIMTLELKKWDMRWITFRPDENKGPVIVLIGRRDTGKTYLVRDLLFYHQDIPIGTVISGTEAGNGFYAAHVPKLFIHEEYSSVLIENILRRQKTVLKQIKKEMETYRRSTIDPRTFVILDDCLYDNSWARDKLMRLLFMNGELFCQSHYQIMASILYLICIICDTSKLRGHLASLYY